MRTREHTHTSTNARMRTPQYTHTRHTSHVSAYSYTTQCTLDSGGSCTRTGGHCKASKTKRNRRPDGSAIPQPKKTASGPSSRCCSIPNFKINVGNFFLFLKIWREYIFVARRCGFRLSCARCVSILLWCGIRAHLMHVNVARMHTGPSKTNFHVRTC